jgi:hypothetical protein
MDISRFKTALSAFTDQPESILLERGHLVIQVGEDLISASTTIRDGQVVVIEDGTEQLAERWLVRRIARLDVLAERLIAALPIESAFVKPHGELIDQVERAPEEIPIQVPDALSAVREFLNRRPAGTCSVLYLTSDAGEGKTTLINELARSQADEFRRKKADWLLVPINLGGRPFLRFDDVVAAALLNQLRFRSLYFEGFLQLVRFGYIVPALDGFEEIFVENAEGDAVSSLGNLIRQMEGEGTLLIAARKAYFEFKALDRQAKLLDALPNADVAFGRIRLNRWGKEEFVTYCKSHRVSGAEALYQDLENRVGPDHPLLTRAVFVKRIVEIANSADRQKFLLDLRPETEDYFSPFINQILERERTEKWIDKYGEPPQPLLTLEEHHELLRLIAEEMWISKTGSLSVEMCSSLAELFCESKHMNPILSRQVRERVKHHALLISIGSTKDQIAFDHDHFREFFLGEQLGSYLARGEKSDLRKMLRTDIVPGWAMDSAVSVAIGKVASTSKLVSVVVETARSESAATFVRENCGALCIRLLERTENPGIVIEEVTFPGNALSGRRIRNVEFRGCYFRPCELDTSVMESLRFQSCEFEHFTMPDSFAFHKVQFVDCKIHGLTVNKGEESTDLYDPSKINRYCEMIGASIEGARTSTAKSIEEVISSDIELELIRKLLLVFMRSTQVSEHVLDLRMGIHSHRFLNDLLPELLEMGLLKEVKHTGGGYTRRYRLGMPVSLIEEAIVASGGLYSQFRDFMSSQDR